MYNVSEVDMSNFSISINYGFFMDDDDRFRLVKDAGFSAVGLWYGKETEDFRIPLDKQFELIKKYGLKVDYLHAPFYYHKQLRDSDKAVREDSIKEHKRWIDICVKQGIDKLVVHLNRLTLDEYVTDTLIDSLKKINEYALKCKVKLAVENIGRPYDLQQVFDKIDNIYFCFDSSHANLVGDSKGDILNKYISNLACLHLSDNEGEKDRHWIFGKGNVDFVAINNILKKGGYTGRINAEVKASEEFSSPSEFLSAVLKQMELYFPDFK